MSLKGNKYVRSFTQTEIQINNYKPWGNKKNPAKYTHW